MQLVLRTIDTHTSALVLRLPHGRYRFGRARDCQVRFREQAISRHHFAVTVGPGDATVCDQGSRHGTMVNGRTITDEQSLREGDRLTVASSSFLVRFVRDEIDLGSVCLTVPGEGQGSPVEIPDPSIAEPVKWAGIGARIYIDGVGRWIGGDQHELERALDLLLSGAGYLEWDEDEGPEWGIDLVLRADADVTRWVERLTAWLQDWPVPKGTVLAVATYPATGGLQHRRIEIPSRTTCYT